MRRKKLFPVLWSNTPIEKDDLDVFYMQVQVQELYEAINENANFIGIVSEHGGGKSSIVRNFVKKYNYTLCNICLWDREGDINEKEKMYAFTHSFFYQLSKMVKNKNFTRHINRLLSSKYKTISWSSDIIGKKLVVIILIVFLYVILMIAGHTYSDICYCTPASQLGKWLVIVYHEEKYIRAMVFMIILLLLYKNSIAFSWKDKSDTMGIEDDYEIFEKILSMTKKKSKYVINIEDLDRVSDKKYIKEFLKVLYRYNNLLEKEDKKRFIFMVSLSEKSFLESEDRIYKEIYEKIFDYILVIRPINLEKRLELLTNLIGKEMDKIKRNLSTDSETFELTDEEKQWFVKGDNLGIREIKSRLNRAMAIYEELKMSENTVNFEKCAIVAYLESAYPFETYHFLKKENPWHRVMKNLDDSRQKGMQDLDRELSKCRRMDHEFKKELRELFENKLDGKDYWLYFHRSPKKTE